MRPFDDISRLERAHVLDKPVAAVRGLVGRALANRKVADALHGTWLGHPVHPALVQFTFGSLMSASLIDMVGGRREYSSALIGTGLALTPPTVASGWADWSTANPDQQRVGLVHAATNVAAVSLYAAALVSRSRGGGGRLLSVAGLALSSLGAVLGGHLAYRQALGPNHADRVPDLAPDDWTPLGPLAEFADGEPARRRAGDAPVLVVRRGAGATVLSDTCPHLGAPLSDGEIVGADGGARIVCPWHGSEFRVDDGGLVCGPSTAPLPRFEARVEDGVLQARRGDL